MSQSNKLLSLSDKNVESDGIMSQSVGLESLGDVRSLGGC